jgi:hypothetical protein
VDFDAAIRAGNARANADGKPLLGDTYLHRSRVPLSEAPIDHVTAHERRVLQGDLSWRRLPTRSWSWASPDGCSP